jgi:hypothetical protein
MRLQRHRMATATSLWSLPSCSSPRFLGVLPRAAFIASSLAILACVLGLYVVFRRGWSQRFRDPSLTLPQMLLASTIILYTMYSAEGARAVFLLLLMMVFLFGVLRFGTKVLLSYAVFILMAYGQRDRPALAQQAGQRRSAAGVAAMADPRPWRCRGSSGWAATSRNCARS